MDPQRKSKLADLSRLLGIRREVDQALAGLLGRPALRGNVGEFIAACVFGVELNDSGSRKGHDGHFTAGPFARTTVNVKFYSRWEGLLDMHASDDPPAYYLVLASDGSDAWSIRDVFLLSHVALVDAGVVPQTAASVRAALCEPGRLFPAAAAGAPFSLSPAQVEALRAFGLGAQNPT